MEDSLKQAITRQKTGLNGIEKIGKKCSGSSGNDGNNLLRNKRIEFCLSPEEFEALQIKVRENNFKNNAEFIRNSCLNSGNILKKTEHIFAIIRLEKQIKKLGTNFNQIARHLNTFNKLEKSTLEEMQLLLKNLNEVYENEKDFLQKRK